MIKALRQKLGSQLGLTLTELLMTTIIVVLASGLLAGAMPLVQNAYTTIVNTSNAEALLSTTVTSLRNELSSADLSTVKWNAKAADGKDTTLITFSTLNGGVVKSIRYCDKEGEQKGIFVDLKGGAPSGQSYIFTPDPNNFESIKYPLVPDSAGAATKTHLTVKFADGGGISQVKDSSENYHGAFLIEKLVVVDEAGEVKASLKDPRLKDAILIRTALAE